MRGVGEAVPSLYRLLSTQPCILKTQLYIPQPLLTIRSCRRIGWGHANLLSFVRFARRNVIHTKNTRHQWHVNWTMQAHLFLSKQGETSQSLRLLWTVHLHRWFIFVAIWIAYPCSCFAPGRETSWRVARETKILSNTFVGTHPHPPLELG